VNDERREAAGVVSEHEDSDGRYACTDWGTNGMRDQQDEGPTGWGTNGMGDQRHGGPTAWETNGMGEKRHGGKTAWGTNWCKNSYRIDTTVEETFRSPSIGIITQTDLSNIVSIQPKQDTIIEPIICD
jgi:hypothetical protein